MADPERKMDSQEKPFVIFTKYSPYLVVDLENFKDAEGNPLQTQPVMSPLCRGGKSAMKPYCGGSHSRIDFVAEKSPKRTPDKIKSYEGRDITIHDNRGVCAHGTSCTTLLPPCSISAGGPGSIRTGPPSKKLSNPRKKAPRAR